MLIHRTIGVDLEPVRTSRCPFVWGLVALVFVVSGCAPSEPEGLGEAIDAAVENAMAEGPIVGLSLAASRGGRVVHAQGYGLADLENQLPATAETIYRVGSITKQFTAAAVMQLVEQGQLKLDATVGDYWPESPSHWRDVTIASLLSHTSGIKNYTTMERWWKSMATEMTPDRVVSVFATEPLDFRPGTDFSYTNSGYFLLGLIIERVSGQPFGGYLHEHLFTPLQLTSTSYCDDHALVPNRARGYTQAEDTFRHADYLSMSQAYAAGAVCSSVLDLLHWSDALADGHVVDHELHERMIHPGTLPDGTQLEYGFGLAVSYLEGHHQIMHVGGTLGFAGHLVHFDEEDVTVAVLSNTQGAKATNIASDVARLLLGLDDRSIKDILLAPDELAAYSGTYDLRLGQVTVSSAGGRLAVDVGVPGAEALRAALPGRPELLGPVRP